MYLFVKNIIKMLFMNFFVHQSYVLQKLLLQNSTHILFYNQFIKVLLFFLYISSNLLFFPINLDCIHNKFLHDHTLRTHNLVNFHNKQCIHLILKLQKILIFSCFFSFFMSLVLSFLYYFTDNYIE